MFSSGHIAMKFNNKEFAKRFYLFFFNKPNMKKKKNNQIFNLFKKSQRDSLYIGPMYKDPSLKLKEKKKVSAN